jgi:aspartate aminotransferase-like enzyme
MELRIPGPTPLPEEVLQAVGQQMINHRGPEFAALLARIIARLKEFFQTEGEIFVLSASGTGGQEAAIVNLLSPGDRVLAVINGYFGERLAAIAEVFGAQLTRLEFPWGRAIDPQVVEARLADDGPFKLVLVVHNETSTGMTNDLAAMAGAVHSLDEASPLLIVDAISSLGAIDLPMDALGCDAVISGSQKAWMAPPGLTMIGLSTRAWAVVEETQTPRFYWDLRLVRRYREQGQTPFTPALSALYGLGRSLELMAEEGLANIFARHKRVGRHTREGVKALGLELLVQDETYASDTVTAVRLPPGMDGDTLLRRLREERGILVGGGQGPFRGRLLRIGHMGCVREADVDVVLEALAGLL